MVLLRLSAITLMHLGAPPGSQNGDAKAVLSTPGSTVYAFTFASMLTLPILRILAAKGRFDLSGALEAWEAHLA